MRKPTVLTLSALFLGAFMLTGGDCPLIPQVEEKAIELAMGGSTTMLLEARGSLNEFSGTDCITINGDEGTTNPLDIAAIIEDAGIEPDAVSAITLAGVSHRVVKPQAGRTITGGTVTISDQSPGGGSATLISGFTGDASAVTDFITADLDLAGVGLINSMLEGALNDVKAGNPVEIRACSAVSGTSTPLDVSTNFDWEIKIDINIVGTIVIDTVDF